MEGDSSDLGCRRVVLSSRAGSRPCDNPAAPLVPRNCLLTSSSGAGALAR